MKRLTIAMLALFCLVGTAFAQTADDTYYLADTASGVTSSIKTTSQVLSGVVINASAAAAYVEIWDTTYSTVARSTVVTAETNPKYVLNVAVDEDGKVSGPLNILCTKGVWAYVVNGEAWVLVRRKR